MRRRCLADHLVIIGNRGQGGGIQTQHGLLIRAVAEHLVYVAGDHVVEREVLGCLL